MATPNKQQDESRKESSRLVEELLNEGPKSVNPTTQQRRRSIKNTLIGYSPVGLEEKTVVDAVIPLSMQEVEVGEPVIELNASDILYEEPITSLSDKDIEVIGNPEILDGENVESLANGIREYSLLFGDKVWASTDSGGGNKKYKPNEDRVEISPVDNQVVVIDGMGGEDRGALAAQVLAEAFRDNPSDPTKATKTASEKLIAEGCAGGACYASVNIHENEGKKTLDISQAGDVKVLIVRDGKIKDETKDEHIVQVLVDKGMISEEEALTHPYRNKVTNAVTASKASPTFSTPTDPVLRKGDLIMIMTDGITDNLTPEEVVKWTRGLTPEQMIIALSKYTDIQMSGGHRKFKMEGKADNRGIAVIKIN